MPVLLKWLRRIALSLIAFVLAILALLALALGTESGTNWVLERVDARMRDTIAIQNVSGTLWRGIRADEIVYLDSARSVRARDVTLVFDWMSVFAGRVLVDVLDAETITYTSLAPPAPVAQPFSFAMPPLPFILAVNAGRVGTFTLGLTDLELNFRNIVVQGANIDGSRLRASSLATDAFGLGMSLAQLDSTLSGDVPLSADLRWTWTDQDWAGRGKVDGSLKRLAFEQTVSGRLPATVFGAVSILDRFVPFYEATVRWQQWSFPNVDLLNGDARISGLLNDYDAVYDVGVQLPGQELSRLQGTAKGNLRSLTEFAADLSNSSGLVSANGDLEWLPAFSARAQARLADVNPSLLRPELSGRINAQADVVLEGSRYIRVTNAELSGDVNDIVVGFTGDIEKSDSRIECGSCIVDAGGNRLAVDGHYDTGNFELDFSVNAPAVGKLWPEIAGALDGRGHLRGSASSASSVFFVGELNGQALRYADWGAEYVAINSRESGRRTLDFAAELRSVGRGDADFGSGTVTAVGPLNELALELDWQVRGVDVSTAAILGIDAASLHGDVSRASIREPNSGLWQLQAPFEFSVRDGAVLAGQHEWRGEIGNLSVAALSRDASGFQFVAKLADVPLLAANRFLPPNIAAQGNANADIDVKAADGAWSGTISWRQTDSVLRIMDVVDENNDFRIPHFSADVTFADGGARGTANIEIEPGVTGELEIALESLAADAQINAELHVRGDDWSWVSAVIPAVDNFEGLVEADIHAAGALTSPDFSGKLNWRNGALVLPALNVPVSNIDVVVSGASDGTAIIDGSAIAGGGQLKLTGRLVNVMSASRSIELQLTGDTAELINLSDYRLWVSPDVVISSSADGWQINGDIGVPRAEIEFRELPVDAVERSPDVVVVGEEPVAENPMRYSGETQFRFGDRVQVSAFGLDTRVTGDLMLRATRDRAPRAEGRVLLEDGVFEAYGQKLTIEEGSLTFTGPLDDPIVDVKAVRVIESIDGKITAGLHLRGRAQNITSSVFSDPVMNEADALSYVMLGRPLMQISETEGGNVSSAAISLGLRQATQITEEIGQSIGLDQLSLTGDGGDSTALIAGKQLNSRVYARYAYGVFSRIGTLLLRYRLSDRLSLEAGAGETQSIDILYTVEKE